MAQTPLNPTTMVQSELRTIAVISASTLATFSGLVMALPVVDLWANILPAPGKYAAIARAVAVLLSALLAHREVRHNWPRISFSASDIRPSGRLPVVVGVGVTLLYLSMPGALLGGWADLFLAVEYSAIIVLLSFGFVRLAKKAYDFASARSRFSASDRSLVSFTTAFFAGVTGVVTGFAVLNEIVGLLPPIVRNSTASAGLSVLAATIFIGSDYTAEYLEQNLDRQFGKIYATFLASLAKKNIVESGLLPVVMGIACLVGYIALDTWLGGKPSDTAALEVLAIVLKIGFFSFSAFGLWRLGVSEYERQRTGQRR